MADAVLVEQRDRILIITINRPAARNAIDAAVTSGIAAEVRLNDWLLFAKSTPAAGTMRGLAQGSIFHRDGTLIATVVQEGIAHRSRPGDSVRPIGEG